MRILHHFSTLLLSITLLFFVFNVNANGIIKVSRKFYKDSGHSLSDFHVHDLHRHSRMLSAIDFPIGGQPSLNGLYFAEIEVGTPAKSYYVQLDTGSVLTWLNCMECHNCPTVSTLGIDLKLYDSATSNTSSILSCADEFCSMVYGRFDGCSIDANMPCGYQFAYGDQSSTSGFIVNDVFTFHQVSAHNQTTFKEYISFGCAMEQSSDFSSSGTAVDGLLGLARSNISILTQLVSAKKTKNVFYHCLDPQNGGGIFAIGQVVQPKVKTTPMITIPDSVLYNVNMTGMEVGGATLQLPSDMFKKVTTIIDSGTTMAYVAGDAYEPLLNAIFSKQPDIEMWEQYDTTCIRYNGSVDDAFPVVTLNFEGSLQLNVHPHEYFNRLKKDIYCLGWLNGGGKTDDTNMFLLGDLVLGNKIVLYDLENNVIGWTDYDCASNIQVQDDKNGTSYTIVAHNYRLPASSASILQRGTIILLLTILIHLVF